MASSLPESSSTPTLQPEGPRKIIRRKNANPLRPPVKASGKAAVVPRKHTPEARPLAAPVPAASTPAAAESEEDEWQTFQLTTTKAELLKDLRHHVMRLQSKRVVNPLKEEEFTRPIRLHRRDPLAQPQGVKEQMLMNAQVAAVEDAATPEEKAKLEAEMAKEAERAAQLAKIAPYQGSSKPKQNSFKKKMSQVFVKDEAERKLRYEEFLPWFIEDFDNKNTWQGQLESSLSHGSYAMFVLDGSNFRMVPIEKWYKFTEKGRFKTLSIEEAEMAYKKNRGMPRWMMQLTKAEEKEAQRKEREANMLAFSNLKTRRGDRLEGRLKTETVDADDLDFDDDRFADDEEAPVMDGEEQENKEIEKRIKREQLSANTFNLRGEKEWEEEERMRKKLEELGRKTAKKTNKLLINREGNYTYATDSDGNPYASESEEDSDEEAMRKEEERKKEEEAKKEQAAKEQDKGKKSAPSSQPEPKPKQSPAKKAKAPPITANGEKNLKRTGTPDLSESGNEKSRKKPRKNPPVAQQQGPATASTGQNQKLVKLKVPVDKLSQYPQLTHIPGAPKPVKKRKANGGSGGGSGSGSGDETGAEMSDGSGGPKKQRIKIVSGGRALSPAAAGNPSSRQGSPAPSGSQQRSGSPAAPGGASSPSAGPPPPITDEEIRALCLQHPNGITPAGFAKAFAARLKHPPNKEALVASIKRMTINKDKLMFLRDEYK